jgi:hypothetical protein
MAVEYLDKNNADGTVFGQGSASTNKISFYGATPVSRPSGSAQAAVTDGSGGAASATTGVQALTSSYNSTLIANALATVIAQTNAFRTALVNLGLIAGS